MGRPKLLPYPLYYIILFYIINVCIADVKNHLDMYNFSFTLGNFYHFLFLSLWCLQYDPSTHPECPTHPPSRLYHTTFTNQLEADTQTSFKMNWNNIELKSRKGKYFLILINVLIVFDMLIQPPNLENNLNSFFSTKIV